MPDRMTPASAPAGAGVSAGAGAEGKEREDICPGCFRSMGTEYHNYPLFGGEAPFDDAHARYVCTNADCECCPVEDDDDDPYYS